LLVIADSGHLHPAKLGRLSNRDILSHVSFPAVATGPEKSLSLKNH
jgi:hypothetical protein